VLVRSLPLFVFSLFVEQRTVLELFEYFRHSN
jgi:hypothetical protein